MYWAICLLVYPGLYASLYTLVGVPASSQPVCTPGTSTRRTDRCVQFYTFNSEVEKRRPLRKGKSLSSQPGITVSRPGTGRFRQRNPLQRVLPHKEGENPLTPPKVLSRPPQGKEPPFHPGTTRRRVLLPGLGFRLKVDKSVETGKREWTLSAQNR